LKIKTRLGLLVSVKDGFVVSQKAIVGRHGTHFILQLANGKTLEVADQVAGVPVEIVKPYLEPVLVKEAPPYEPRKLPRAEDCKSAGGAITAARAPDEFAGEKVKGETFFTHKTSPGLVIKSPRGDVVHETKMSDMYKRR
jgi:hypothetical protein